MSMALTNSGHITHAEAMRNLTFHLAWGGLPDDYEDPWNLGDTPPASNSTVVTSNVTRSPAGDLTDTLPNVGVLKLVKVMNGGVEYTIGVDCQLNANQIEWLGSNRPADNAVYTATYRYVTDQLVELVEEFGRRDPTQVQYVIEDVDGPIVANDLRWSISPDPTPNLYLEFKFDSTDAVGQIIHQVGLFIGTVPDSGVPVGKKYLLPTEIADPGKFYMIDNLDPFARFAGKRELFEYVISF